MKTLTQWLNILTERKRSYETVFGASGLVDHASMRHLAWTCFAFRTTVVPGNRDQSNINEGRRQVWLLIAENLGFTPEELLQLYGNAIRQGEES